MSQGDDIIARASSLFDVVGVAKDPESKDTILLLGMVTTPERDLDDFVSDSKKFIMRGFERYAKAKQDALLKFIRKQGFSAELVGKLGYPLHGKPNLKHLAVAAGLGKQGKNTLVINSRFGPWLRFMAVRTNAPLQATGLGVYVKEENPDCKECQRCIDACPVKVLEPYRLLDEARCLASISSERRGGLAICDKCVIVCPVGERRLPGKLQNAN